MVDFYVSSLGADTNSGTIKAPLFSIQAAIKRINDSPEDYRGKSVNILLRSGMYFLRKKIILNEKLEVKELHVRTIDNEPATLSGGYKLEGWKPYTKKIWVVKCPISFSRQFYFNNRRQQRAKGKFPRSLRNKSKHTYLLLTRKLARWNNPRDIEVVYKIWWTLSRILVDNIKGRRLKMQNPAYTLGLTKEGRKIREPTWIENAFELLSDPGEWYFDRKDKSLYFIPPHGENPNDGEAIVGNAECLMEIKGTPEIPVSNITFEKLGFMHTTWYTSLEKNGGFPELQANVYVRMEKGQKVREMLKGSLYCEFIQEVNFKNCSFTHLGSAGLDLRKGVRKVTVEECEFRDISGNGIQIGEIYHPEHANSHPSAVSDITIRNNHISDCGTEFWGACGIFAAYVHKVSIIHNTICHLPYTGISLGWGWSDEPTVCAENSIIANHIYDVCNKLIDGGGIYTLSLQPKTNVAENHVHDSGWNGLYPDEKSSEMFWVDNVTYRCKYTIQNHTMLPKEKIFISNNYFDTLPSRPDFKLSEYIDENVWDLNPKEMLENPRIKDIIEKAGIRKK